MKRTYLFVVILVKLLDSHAHGASHLHNELGVFVHGFWATGDTVVAVSQGGDFFTAIQLAEIVESMKKKKTSDVVKRS